MAYKMEEQYNSPNYTPMAQVAAVFGIARTVKSFTQHWWGVPDTGMTYEGVIGWLCRPGGNTSAHYVTDGPTRRVACLVSPYDASWAGGTARANATSTHIENNCNTDARMSTMDVSAELLADLRDPNAFGDQIVYGHSDWVATQCPGHIDIHYIDELSYKKQPGVAWGDVRDKGYQPAPQPAPKPTPEPTPVPVEAEWVRNVKDTDMKLSVLPAVGTHVIDLNTLQVVPNSLIPRGTQVDIAKETTVGGKKFYISSYSATRTMARGIVASDLGAPARPPVNEKPEWLKNIQDIEDVDMWTRSDTPVLNLADGRTVQTLSINTKVCVIKATTVLDEKLMVLDGEKTCIQTVYLSDKPITDPDSDIIRENNTLLKQIISIVQTILDKLTSIFKEKQ